MKEIFSKLLENTVLTDETKAALETTLTETFESAIAQAREEALTEARAEVAGQWQQERTALIEAIQDEVTEGVSASVASLNEAKAELENLKVDLSQRYIKREQQLAEKVRNELNALVTDLDGFLKEAVANHLKGVSADLEAIKQDNFGRTIYNAFVKEFVAKQMGSAEMQRIAEATKVDSAKLNAALEENAQLRTELAESKRQTKIKELLAPLAGENRKVMEAILVNTPMVKLDETFKTSLSRVLKTHSEKEQRVLAEGNKTAAAPVATKGKAPAKGVVVTGNETPRPARSTADQLTESAEDVEMRRHLQKVAGIRVK